MVRTDSEAGNPFGEVVTLGIIRGLLAMLPALFLTGCGPKEAAFPISDTELKALLRDIHTSEAALQSVFSKRKDSLRTVYMNQIYRIHRTDSASVSAILFRLREDPVRLDRIYREMLDEMADIPD